MHAKGIKEYIRAAAGIVKASPEMEEDHCVHGQSVQMVAHDVRGILRCHRAAFTHEDARERVRQRRTFVGRTSGAEQCVTILARRIIYGINVNNHALLDVFLVRLTKLSHCHGHTSCDSVRAIWAIDERVQCRSNVRRETGHHVSACKVENGGVAAAASGDAIAMLLRDDRIAQAKQVEGSNADRAGLRRIAHRRWQCGPHEGHNAEEKAHARSGGQARRKQAGN